MMNFKVGENGEVYYPCPDCGQPLKIDPDGFYICTKCAFVEPIGNLVRFVERHNSIQEVFIELPKEIERACAGLIGKPINEETFQSFTTTVENAFRMRQERRQIFNWRVSTGTDHNIQCRFSLAMDRDPNREFRLDYGIV